MAALLAVSELRFPVHFLMRVRMLSSDDFRTIINGAGAEQFLTLDDDGFKPCHYLMYDAWQRNRRSVRADSVRMPSNRTASARPIRSQETIANLLVGASAAHLRMSSRHAGA